MNNQYDVNYFIQKFSAIPDDKWCEWIRHDSQGRSCALGHTHPVRNWNGTPETNALAALFGSESGVACINNGLHKWYQQPTPRARILAALHDAKARAEAALDEYETRKLDLIPHGKEQLA